MKPIRELETSSVMDLPWRPAALQIALQGRTMKIGQVLSKTLQKASQDRERPSREFLTVSGRSSKYTIGVSIHMQIINVRGPGTTLWSNSDVATIASRVDNKAPATSIPRQPIEELLIKVGKRVLGDELHTEYMSIAKVARVAQKYKVPWTGGSQSARKLEELATQYFENQDRILGDGIKVTWRIQRDGWESELQLRFHKHDPANDGPMPN